MEKEFQEQESKLIRAVNKILVDLAYYNSTIKNTSDARLNLLDDFRQQEAQLKPIESFSKVCETIESFGSFFNIAFQSVFALLNENHAKILGESNQRLENALLAFAEMPLLSSQMKKAVLEVIGVIGEVNFLKEQEIKATSPQQFSQISSRLKSLKRQYGYLLDQISLDGSEAN